MAKTVYKSPEIREQYKHERARIQRQVSRMKKRGYYFDTNVIPDIPKYVDEGSVRNLQKRTTKYLYEKAKWKDPLGMESAPTSGHARNIERRRASEKGVQTRKSRAVARKATQRQPEQENKQPPKPKEPEKEEEEIKPEPEDNEPEREDDTYDEDFDDDLQEKIEPEEPKEEKKYTPTFKKGEEAPKEGDAVEDELERVLNHIYEIIDSWTPGPTWSDYMREVKEEDKDNLRKTIDDILRKYDRKTLGENAKKNGSRIIELAEEIAYKTSGGTRHDYDVAREKVDANLVELISLLTDGHVSPQENYGLTEMQESYEIDY